MPAFRVVAAIALSLAVAAPFAVPAPAAAAETPVKVALIVGPMGSQTSWNRQHADQIAAYATSMGATVTKAYSPNATYAKVRAAVAGANIIVYYGHGSGFPNPYTKTLAADRANGWGLNTTTTNGDKDSWSNGTLVYCGEKALRGQLTANDGAAQRKYCGAGAIAPAAGFVMVYVGSCYTAGGNEPQNPKATNAEARAHASYYSRPMFQLGASGYFAGHTMGIVQALLENPDLSYGDIFNAHLPWDLVGAYETTHQLLPDLKVWLTRETDTPYWDYAFVGDPARTFNGGTAAYTAPTDTADFYAPRVSARTPAGGKTGVAVSTNVVVKFTEPVSGTVTNLSLWRGDNKVSATVTWDAATLTATLNPNSNLARGVQYTIKFGTNIKDFAGNKLAASKSWFKTAY